MNTLPSTSIRSLRQAGAALRARRRACNLTQKQLAAATGTAQSTNSDIETGVVSVSLDAFPYTHLTLPANLRAAHSGIAGSQNNDKDDKLTMSVV